MRTKIFLSVICTLVLPFTPATIVISLIPSMLATNPSLLSLTVCRKGLFLKLKLCFNSAVGVEKRELFKIYNIRTSDSVSLCQNTHFTNNVSTCHINKLFNSV